MNDDPQGIAERLRATGLRVTPQRRAILAAFSGRKSEHWTAEEVYERARRVVPEIGRGTVYGTLAELVRAGLLAVVGRSEAVRYETNVDARHQHFRCRACGRLYDVYPNVADRLDPPDDGFVVESVLVTFEGTCRDCVELERSLAEAASAPETPPAEPPGEEELGEVAYAELESPLGTMIGAVTERGLVRLAFGEEEGEEAFLDRLGRRHARVVGEPGALAEVQRQLEEYFAGRRRDFELAVDWRGVGEPRRQVLKEITKVGYGRRLTYRGLTEAIDADPPGAAAGDALGANPLAIVVPCHRVLRADGGLGGYVGGVERKRRLLDLEREFERG